MFTLTETMRFKDLNQDIPFVKKDNLRLLFTNLRDASFTQNIKNWLKQQRLLSLKRGLYIFKSYWDKCLDKDGYLNYLSSILYSPSYVSKETILARYGMFSEAVYGITCVTSKTSRIFKPEMAIFSYSKIKSLLFTGFQEEFYLGNHYFTATKAKALFDYLYFYQKKISVPTLKNIEELRINFEIMQADDWREFKKYLKLANSKKLNSIYTIIKSLNHV